MWLPSRHDKSGVENEDLKEWRELQTRWNQFGAFIPLFRAHGQYLCVRYGTSHRIIILLISRSFTTTNCVTA